MDQEAVALKKATNKLIRRLYIVILILCTPAINVFMIIVFNKPKDLKMSIIGAIVCLPLILYTLFKIRLLSKHMNQKD